MNTAPYTNTRWHIIPDLIDRLRKVPGAFALLNGPIVMPKPGDEGMWVCLAAGSHLAAYPCTGSIKEWERSQWHACHVTHYRSTREEFPGAAFDYDILIQHLGKGIRS